MLISVPKRNTYNGFYFAILFSFRPSLGVPGHQICHLRNILPFSTHFGCPHWCWTNETFRALPWHSFVHPKIGANLTCRQQGEFWRTDCLVFIGCYCWHRLGCWQQRLRVCQEGTLGTSFGHLKNHYRYRQRKILTKILWIGPTPLHWHAVP